MSEKTYPEDELTCKPLDTITEITRFLEDPPPWRTMCKELIPHSESKIVNMEVVEHSTQYEINTDEPEIFCHLSSQKQETEDPIRHEGKTLPKTLVCHDMAGGYHDDCYIDGTKQYDHYAFYNWGGIDIFCYFSHHLITVPPVGWINVAHAHGVKVIGTIITEHLNGMTFWDKLLKSETEYQSFANNLVSIAKILKFEGWLLNVENKVSNPEALICFVRYFHRVLHEQVPHAELIWYDSVTVTGNLNWQNGLNFKNRAYFDACDGIFTNYSWNETDLETSAQAAGGRLTDLYIGIDVWGRNFYGGGEFSTQEAIKLVSEFRCSLAIFAPAWTHEAMTEDPKNVNYVTDGEKLTPWQRFILRDRALWSSLWPYLYTRLPNTLPFRSSFCKGQGKKRRTYGEVISHGPWYNLRYQQYQPNSAYGPHGYMLAPQDVILTTRQMAITEHKGLIRMSASAATLIPSVDGVASSTHRASANHSAGKKFKDLVKGLFGKSKTKKDEETATPAPSNPEFEDHRGSVKIEVGPKESDIGPAASTSLAARDKKSMMTMSLSLKLGQGRSTSGQRLCLVHVPDDKDCLEICHEESFLGGSSFLVCEGRMVRLLHCDFECRSSLVVCVVSKPLARAPAQWLNVKLRARSRAGPDAEVCLVGRELAGGAGGAGGLAAGGVARVAPLAPAAPRFAELQAHMLQHEPGFYVPLENPYGWHVRYYEVSLAGLRLTSVNLVTGMPSGDALLGLLAMCHGPAPAPAR